LFWDKVLELPHQEIQSRYSLTTFMNQDGLGNGWLRSAPEVAPEALGELILLFFFITLEPRVE